MTTRTGAGSDMLRTLDDSLAAALSAGREAVDLPSLPDVCFEVLELTRDEDADAGALSQVLHRDPALAGHVLRVANSAAIAGHSEISNLRQAIGRLGFAQIAEIALTVTLHGKLFDGRRFTDLVDALWQHATLSAVAAKGIARQIRRNVESVYLCGLLHDVGHAVALGIVQSIEARIGCFADRCPPQGLFELLDRHHVAAGLALAEHWHLPVAIRDAIARHGDLAEAGAGGATGDEVPCETAIVTVADLFAAHGAGAFRAVSIDDLRGAPALVALDLYPEDVDELLGQLPRWIDVARAMG
jgi:putative nucleotidyltransferase with HDIG domain